MSLDNPRKFPRFMKHPKPLCPVHNRAMKSSKQQLPPFVGVAINHRKDIRTIWHCPVEGCHRVTHGEVRVYQNREHRSDGWLNLI